MQLDHEFRVPVPVATAWTVLLDVERIAPCMPGATLTKVDGQEFEGKVRVKVGPITVTYRGSARFSEVDEQARTAVIVARGKEARGPGTADATITAELHDEGEATRVNVRTNLAITGRPAQFGRSVMNDVGAKLIGRFADCLAEKLAEQASDQPGDQPSEEPAAETAHEPVVEAEPEQEPAAAPVSEPAPVPAPARAAPARPFPADEPIDILEAAGGPLLRRYGPPLAALFAFLVVVMVLRRRRP